MLQFKILIITTHKKTNVTLLVEVLGHNYIHHFFLRRKNIKNRDFEDFPNIFRF